MWPTSYVSPFPEWAQRQILTPHKICGPHYMWPTTCDAAAASVAVEMSGLPKLETSRDDNICMRTDKVIYLPQNMWPTLYVAHILRISIPRVGSAADPYSSKPVSFISSQCKRICLKY